MKQAKLEHTSNILSPIYAKVAALNTDRGFSTLGGLGSHLSYPRYESFNCSTISHKFQLKSKKIPIEKDKNK